ncbi:MAG TPA: efflux RND transporter periplasmic adaptor subunit [Terriglobales bacterium]|nr:efflux RND transporter periplasmic adaptor subunit [Terriglobales bacterium]
MKRAVTLALSMVLALILASCTDASDTSKVAAAAPAAPAPSTPAASDDRVFVASGPIVVENQVDVAALREGVVVSILAEPNTHVRKGQLLAQLDDRQISADLDAASAKTRSIQADLKNWQAETKVLESDLARAQKLWEAGVFTRETLEHAQYKVEADRFEISRQTELLTNAQATERSLALEKEKTRITAPFDGIVARRYVRVGQKVGISDRLFWVTAVAPLEVRFTLPERFLGKVKNGQTVSVELSDGSPPVHHIAAVTQISPVVDPSSGTIEVLARLQGQVSDLRPGMLTTIRLANPK